MMKVYKHLKTGGRYLFIGKAKLEWNLHPVIVYKCIKSEQIWVRPEKEFFDGRFIQVKNEHQM
jgi:hypothetical protein